MRLPAAEANANVDFQTARVDAGAGAGKIRIYDDTSRTTLLAELPLNDPAYTAGGVQGGGGAGLQPATPGRAWLDVTTAAVEDATPAATGTAAFADVVDSDNNIRQEGNVGLTSSGEFVELNSLSIQTTVPVQCTNGYLQTSLGAL